MWKYLNIFFVILGASGQNLNVSVYYETLCPDSMQFISQQLFPTYKELGDRINLDLIPFGKAKIVNESENGTFAFICQHGPKECYGNEIHSCALALYSEEEGAEFVYCSMKSPDPSLDTNLEQCANSTGISWASLDVCYKSGQGDKLLEINGLLTEMVQPDITFIPTVIFNNQFNETVQNDAIADFLNIACEFLNNEPTACKKFVDSTVSVHLV